MAVSFHHDVAPIFAYHCNSCHGDAGGLNLRTYQSALEGGNKGKLLIAGDPDNSLLIHFTDGRRGPAHRMPLDGPPLSQQQLQTLRRWIAEGAREDAKPHPKKPYKTNSKKPYKASCKKPYKTNSKKPYKKNSKKPYKTNSKKPYKAQSVKKIRRG